MDDKIKELKNCPFCNGEAELHRDVDEYRTYEMVTCPKPKCVGGEVYVTVREWNTRAITPREQKLREALEFYSSPSDYKSPLTGGLGKLYYDCGAVAKAALEEK